MRYKLLGRSGLRVSELCLGTMVFGMPVDWGADPAAARAIYDRFREAGGNFVDTANEIYANGESERIVADLVAGHRDEVVIATKYTNAMNGDVNRAGNHRKSMVASLERSLKRLGTDYVDMLWVHVWDFLTPEEEVMRALDDLVRSGKILYVGISNAPAWIVSRCNMLAELRGWTAFVGLQIEYNLAQRAGERDLLPMARALELGVLAWSPLGGGLFTGKHGAAPLSAPDSSRMEAMKAFAAPDGRKLAIADAVNAMARDLGRPPSQVALAWLRAKGVIPVLGARTQAQIEDNLACVDLALDPGRMAELDEISAIELGYPHDFLAMTRHGLTTGGYSDRIDAPATRGGVRAIS